ncbi:M12 family metallopeptidase [Sorangium sp. So ce426]|uniref:M12 family metallopeptidase n=1 Tax=unclassified Sorangium TaxID=2621164 RepID=UPI003F5B5DF8
MRNTLASQVPVCIPKLPPPEKWKELAAQAKAIRPDNLPPGFDPEDIDLTEQGKLALVIRLRWPKRGVRLTVGFLDNPEPALRRKILAYANMWNKTGNIEFVETQSFAESANVRIARGAGGYWSWLGIDILNHPGQPTMNLQGFTLRTPESEFRRVVPHEFGHTLGFPHEHLRAQLVELLDFEKTVDYFMRTQGWSREDVIFQVLTPLEESSFFGTTMPDQESIMAYQIPGECTKSGIPILGGETISETDYAFVAREYPKP